MRRPDLVAQILAREEATLLHAELDPELDPELGDDLRALIGGD